jgi:hypothetical protein
MWRQLSILTVLALLISVGGCASTYSSDPLIRMEENMIDGSNDGQMIADPPYRFWMSDQKDNITPYRVHGGVGPASSSFSD